MEKLYIEPRGTVIAIGIEGTPEEIKQRFNSFWNFGATDGELIWKDLQFAYFWTKPARLKKYFETSSLHKILGENPDAFKGKKGGVMEAARKLAKERRGQLEVRNFVHIMEICDINEYQQSLDGIRNELRAEDLASMATR